MSADNGHIDHLVHQPLIIEPKQSTVRMLLDLKKNMSNSKRALEHIEDEHTETNIDSSDRAAQHLQQSRHAVELTPENNARVLRKIDLIILPTVLGVYFLQAIDKATLAYASVFGLTEDTNLQGQEYSWLGAVVYIAWLAAQPLAAYLLVKTPLAKFLFVTVVLWGIVLSVMPVAHDFTGLLITRLLLGLFEAGVAPAFIALTQMWWRRREQPLRLAAWYSMNGITFMFGSLITWGLGHISSPHLKSYQIIFLFFGLLTLAYSAIIFFFLPDSPMTAQFLTAEERLIAIERLRDNKQGVDATTWEWSHVKEAFFDLKTWMWAFMMFAISVPSGGISTFGPLIISAFGFDKFETILLNIPFGAVQLIATLLGAFVATKIKMKSPVLVFLSLPPIAGCIMLLYLPRTEQAKGALLAAYYMISVYPGITPLIYSWSAANTAGETKKKATSAFLIIFQAAGNVVGPNLYTTQEKPLYHRGLRSNLSLFIVLIGLYAVQVAYLVFLNKKHASKRKSLGKKENIVDKSMLKVTATDSDKEDCTDREDQEFDNRTDWQNEDFIYVF